MTQPDVLIAGGGIGGLATALTLHQIGVPCLVLESAARRKPLGVGINLQPNVVRDLYDGREIRITAASRNGPHSTAPGDRRWCSTGSPGPSTIRTARNDGC